MPTCADVKNVYVYTSASLYIFTAWRAQGTVLWHQLNTVHFLPWNKNATYMWVNRVLKRHFEIQFMQKFWCSGSGWCLLNLSSKRVLDPQYKFKKCQYFRSFQTSNPWKTANVDTKADNHVMFPMCKQKASSIFISEN